MSTMANYWANQGWDVVLLTLSSPESDFYRLDNRIERIGLGLSRDSHNIFAAVLNNLVSSGKPSLHSTATLWSALSTR